PHVLYIVDAQALLGGGRAVPDTGVAGELRGGAEEVRLELHHPGTCEHQGRIAALQGARREMKVAALDEVLNEAPAQLVYLLDPVTLVVFAAGSTAGFIAGFTAGLGTWLSHNALFHAAHRCDGGYHERQVYRAPVIFR